MVFPVYAQKQIIFCFVVYKLFFNWLFDSKRTTVHFRTPLCFAIILIISLLSFWHARCISIVASGQRRKMKKVQNVATV